MIELGIYNTLYITRGTDNGVYLAEDDPRTEVLLPNRFVPEGWSVGDEMEVFVFKDSEDRPTATTEKPKIKLFEYEALEVLEVNKTGAFLDWGLSKDLLVPFSEQSRKMEKGKKYLVYLYHDTRSDRLVASSRLYQFLEKDDIRVKEGDQVDLLVWEDTELGTKVLVEDEYSGLIYKNDLFKKIYPGDRLKGFVRTIRKDGKLDISLRKQGYDGEVIPNAQRILKELEDNEGFIPLTDKSSPDDIYDTLEMSKKTFKKAIGGLYKRQIIRIEPEGIHLIGFEKQEEG